MTLKNFHLVFIACSSALAFGLGVWVLRGTALTGAPRLAGSIGAFVVGAGLIAYEAWFLRYAARQR